MTVTASGNPLRVRATRLPVLVALFACSMTAAVTNTFAQSGRTWVESGIKQFAQKDFAAALTSFERASQHGEADAMYRLGHLYELGLGVKLDPAHARRWYYEASKRGSLAAMSAMGSMFAKGNGVAKSTTIAQDWYAAAAQRGSAEAMNRIGLLFDQDAGSKADLAIALKWYQEAASRGNSAAMHNIGNLYYRGSGVPTDKCSAKAWYERSMKKDHSVSASERQTHPKGYFGLTPAALAHIHLKGECGTPDVTRARELFQVAIENGSEEARTALARLDQPARGTTTSRTEWREVEYEYTIYRYESAPPPPAYVPPISPFYGSCHNPMGC